MWRASQVEDYYLFPGSQMRMLDASGRRWTRKVRPEGKPLSRDGARVAFRALEVIAKVQHVEGRGWYGLRRIAADLAESATTDDRVKDRLGGWQDSETRKQIYQDRQSDELRTEAAKVRRALRLGALAAPNGKEPATGVTGASGNPAAVDLDALVAGLTDEQKAVLAAKINGRMGPVMGQVKIRRDPLGSRRPEHLQNQELPKSGRWDSNPRRPAWEGGRKTSPE